MKVFSKRVKRLTELAQAKEQAIAELFEAARTNKPHRGKADALAAIEREIAEKESAPDEYTCPQCGKNFEHQGNHIDLLVASCIFFDKDGEPSDFRDFGLADARRIKICAACAASWKIRLQDYVDL